MRDSAFSEPDRFAKDAFISQIGKSVPLKFGDEVIGEAKLVSVIANEGYAQAIFDIDLVEDAGPAFRQKSRVDYSIVEDKTCRCNRGAQ